MDIGKEVIEIIRKNTGIEEIALSHKFHRDLGLDSIEFIELILKIEEKTGVEFCDEEMPKIQKTKVQDLINEVERKYKTKRY